MLAWWLFIFFNHLENTNQNFLYGAVEGALPVLAAIFGFVNVKKWGGHTSAMGRAVLYLSFGLLTWGVGTLIFAYYNIFLDVEVPYPSLADASYILSWFLWAISMINLSKATGVKFGLRKILGRMMLFIIPIIISIFSYYVLIVVARGGALISDIEGGWVKTFFDLAYPIGDIVILTIALLVYGLSFNYLGGFFKWPIIIILAGFVFNYIGDFSFVYSVTKETFYVGNWVDLVYTLAFFMLGLGACLMDPLSFSKHSDK